MIIIKLARPSTGTVPVLVVSSIASTTDRDGVDHDQGLEDF
jgi:hypothetical protein